MYLSLFLCINVTLLALSLFCLRLSGACCVPSSMPALRHLPHGPRPLHHQLQQCHPHPLLHLPLAVQLPLQLHGSEVSNMHVQHTHRQISCTLFKAGSGILLHLMLLKAADTEQEIIAHRHTAVAVAAAVISQTSSDTRTPFYLSCTMSNVFSLPVLFRQDS